MCSTKTVMSIHEWSVYVNAIVSGKGFTCPSGIGTVESSEATLAKLMLIVSELGEACEAVREGDEDNFREELADTVIRILHMCGAMDIDLEGEIAKKMKVNTGRPMLHGKRL